MRKDKIIYGINVEDVQNGAHEVLGRDLTDRELNVIELKIGDRIDWYGAILSVISEHIVPHHTANSPR